MPYSCELLAGCTSVPDSTRMVSCSAVVRFTAPNRSPPLKIRLATIPLGVIAVDFDPVARSADTSPVTPPCAWSAVPSSSKTLPLVTASAAMALGQDASLLTPKKMAAVQGAAHRLDDEWARLGPVSNAASSRLSLGDRDDTGDFLGVEVLVGPTGL